MIIHSELRDGSLREAARKRNVSMLLFEGGQALRFDEGAIKIGLNSLPIGYEKYWDVK